MADKFDHSLIIVTTEVADRPDHSAVHTVQASEDSFCLTQHPFQIGNREVGPGIQFVGIRYGANVQMSKPFVSPIVL